MLRLSLLALLVLAGCVRQTPPPPPPVQVVRPAPRPVLQPAPATDWVDRALTPGRWSYAGGVATYGAPGSGVLTMRCDRDAQQIEVSRPGEAAGPMTLRATTGARAYQAVVNGGRAVASLAIRDPQLDALAFSRGRFLVGLAGAADVIVPTWPEVTRVIEDCRAGR